MNRSLLKKRWIIIIVISVVFLINYLSETIPLSLSRSSADTSADITVLCYNVKCRGTGYDEKQNDIAKVILQESPDVVFLCEFHKSVSKKLDSILTKVGGYMSSYRKHSNSIFYCKYKLDSLTAIDVGTSSGRFAINNKVHVLTPYGTFSVIGCHLSSSRLDLIGGYKCRKRESDSVYKVCMNEQRPLIVMGDLNDLSCSPPVKRIEGLGLKDAWWEGGCGYGATYHDGLIRLRVDHILYDYDRLELVDVNVIDNELSDHNALMAKFKIKKKQ